MEKKNNWQDFKEVLDRYNIKKLYHFTDRDNLENIIRHGGLFHCLKHFSLNGIGLNNNKNEKNDTFDLFHITYLLGHAFKDAVNNHSNEGTIIINDTHKLRAVFYKEEELTGIYFVKTMRKESK